MVTNKDTYKLIERAAADATYRDLLRSDPQKAAEAMGLSLSGEQVAQLTDRNGDWHNLLNKIENMGPGPGPVGACMYGGG